MGLPEGHSGRSEKQSSPGAHRRLRYAVAARWAELAVWRDVRATLPAGVWSGLACVAMLLCARRLSDPASLRLSGLQLGVAATVAAGLLVAARVLLARLEPDRPAAWLRFGAALAAAAPILALLAGTSRPLPLGWGAYIVGVAAATGAASWSLYRDRLEGLLRDLTPWSEPPTRDAADLRQPIALPLKSGGGRLATLTARLERRPQSETVPVVQHAAESTPSITTQWPETADRVATARALSAPPLGWRLVCERLPTSEAREKLRGTVTAEFQAGQTLTTAHVPFQPPLAIVPEFRCRVAEAGGVRIRSAAATAFGLRLELKRTGDATSPLWVELQFESLPTADALRAA